MSIEVMAKVWKHSPYGEGTLLVLLAMADWANDDGFCWPSIPQLAHKSRQSERNVRYNLRRLEEDKVIDRVEHRGKGHRNEYQINLQNLQGLPDFDTKSGKNTSSSITYKRKPAKPANLQNLQVATSKPASSDTKPASSDISHIKDARAEPSLEPSIQPSVAKTGRDRDKSKNNGNRHDEPPPTPEQQDEAIGAVKGLIDGFLGRFAREEMPPADDRTEIAQRKADQLARAKNHGLLKEGGG
jgi:hypothetical protein